MTQIHAHVVLASTNAYTEQRLYTFVLTYPRIILPEVNTHRMLSRNTASSRAVPARVQRDAVLNDPFVPSYIGAHRAGMQAGDELVGVRRAIAERVWSAARYPALGAQWVLGKLGVHKQITNRLVEPWMWVTQIVTATDLNNFFKLRLHGDAEPHIYELAERMKQAMRVYEYGLPQTKLGIGDWHLPFITQHDWLRVRGRDDAKALMGLVSAARCARVSYTKKPGTVVSENIDTEIALAKKLSKAGHWSPFEHQAMPLPEDIYAGNLRSWKQFRKFFPNEHGGDR